MPYISGVLGMAWLPLCPVMRMSLKKTITCKDILEFLMN